MARNMDWRGYVDETGNFELASYLYSCVLDLMKNTLDMGTLLSTDQARLRAYKEQVKSIFKGRWMEMAEALEYFDIIVPCGCEDDEFCRLCGGARYRLNSALSPDQMQEIAMVVSTNFEEDPKIQRKLQEGLIRALEELDEQGIEAEMPSMQP